VITRAILRKCAAKTPKNPLQNALSDLDGQGDPPEETPSQIAKKRPSARSAENALADVLEDLFEKSLAEAAAEELDSHAETAEDAEEKPLKNSECRAKNPATCRTHGTLREVKTKGFQDQFGNGNPETLTANPKMNAERGKAVISHILAKKSGYEPHAMYRKDLGWIGVDYGKPGNANNSYNGGHGISHIVGKHEGAIDGAVDVILSGTTYKHNESRRKVFIIKDRTAIVLSKDRGGRLLITDFEKITDKQLADYTSRGKYHAKGENE
jgi:hypothetical protein